LSKPLWLRVTVDAPILLAAMTAKFLPTVLHGQNWTYIRLSGLIDEDNRLQDLAAEVRGQLLLIDLVDIERINSCGVRDWVHWLDTVTQGVDETVLLDCAPSIVAQLNLVGNFAANASVLSIIAPYFCEACDLERSTVLEVSALLAADAPRAPSLTCEACATPMAFDDIEESYFAFLSDVRPAHARPQLNQSLTEAREMLGEPTGPLNPQFAETQPPLPMHDFPDTVSPIHASAASTTWDGPPEELDPVVAPPNEQTRVTALNRSDMLFYVAVGVLSALLMMVIYQIAVP